MKELSNYELCLLILLCYKRSWLNRGDCSNDRHNDFYNAWTKLQNTVNEYCNDTAITITNQEKNIEDKLINWVEIKVVNRELLNKFLDDYVNNLKEDTLKSHKSITNFETLEHEFWTSIDKSVNLKDYYIDETKYLPIILWGLRKEQILIKEIVCNIFQSEENLEHIPNIQLRRIKVGQNDFNFGLMIDLYNYVKLKENNNQSVEKPKFEPKQQKLYDYVVRHVCKNGLCGIDSHRLAEYLGYDLFYVCDRNAINTLVSDTNKTYRLINEINNEKVKLLKKSSKTGLYNIWKDFKP